MPIVSLPGGQLRDEIRQPLVDTVTLEPGEGLAGNRRFFESIQGKNLAQTNMTINGQLPTATSFRVQGLSMDAQNVVAANVLALPTLLAKSSMRLFIGEKDYWKGPTRFVAGRMQSFAALDNQAAPTSLYHQQFGWSAIQAICFAGRHVIDINPLQSFYVEWVQDATTLATAEAAFTVAANTDIPFVCSLKGLLRRPVQ